MSHAPLACDMFMSILSLSINPFYIMYNPVIVLVANYFVLWNEFHITVLFILKGIIAASPDEILMAS